MPQIIVITGLPGTGKTTLGKRLSKDLSIPFISKDAIKELLFDTLGWQDRESSRRFWAPSFGIMYHIASTILWIGGSVILETNFDPKFANERIRAFSQEYGCRLLQIRCFSDGDVLFDRFRARASSSERHPWHCDVDNFCEWEPIIRKGTIDALDLGAPLIDIDTTDFDSVDYEKILEWVKEFFENNPE